MRKLIKGLLILLSVILLAIGAFYSYIFLYKNGYLLSKEEKFFYQELKTFVDSGEDSIELKKLTNFEWDEVCSYRSYSPSEGDTYLTFYSQDKLIRKIYGHQSYFMLNIVKDRGYIEFGYIWKDKEKGIIQDCFDQNVKTAIIKRKINYGNSYTMIIYTITFIIN